MCDEYNESCWECGFNQKDQDEREKREKQELIEEFVEDLDELVEWCKYLPVDSEINIRLGRKVEKWEKMLNV